MARIANLLLLLGPERRLLPLALAVLALACLTTAHVLRQHGRASLLASALSISSYVLSAAVILYSVAAFLEDVTAGELLWDGETLKKIGALVLVGSFFSTNMVFTKKRWNAYPAAFFLAASSSLLLIRIFPTPHTLPLALATLLVVWLLSLLALAKISSKLT